MIHYAIVGKQPLFKNAFKLMLKEYDNGESFSFLTDVNNLATLRDGIKKIGFHPAVVFVDIGPQFYEGLRELAEIAADFPDSYISALSDFMHTVATKKILEAGANSVIDKNLSPDIIYQLIRNACTTIAPQNKLINGTTRKICQEALSEREKCFLRLCVSEMTYKEIASEMHVSFSTVNNYREALFAKLGIKNRVGLVLFAINYMIANPNTIP